MKHEKMKRVALYSWRILVIALINLMILLMLWNGHSASALSKYGSTGDEVAAIQQKLQELGYSPGAADGIYGSKTQEAVTAFQRDQGLDADGIAGKNTLESLGLTSSSGGYVGYTESDLQLLATIISA